MAEPEPDLTTLHAHRAVRGDAGSLDWLVSRLTPLLLAQADYRLGAVLRRRYEPEDVVNDVWLVALPRLGDLAPRAGRLTPVLLSFLSTTLVYRVNNLMRKHVGGDAAASLEQGRGDDQESRIDVSAEVTGVVTAACRRETRSAVGECLAALDPKDREILVLRGIEQNSNPAVARLLGLTESAVAARYHRALQRLRKKLPGSVFEEL